MVVRRLPKLVLLGAHHAKQGLNRRCHQESLQELGLLRTKLEIVRLSILVVRFGNRLRTVRFYSVFKTLNFYWLFGG